MKKTIIKHRFSNIPPTSTELAIGELAIQVYQDKATLYTKDINGEIVEIGKGAAKLEDLEDVDLTNVEEGSFLIKQGDIFTATNFIGNLSNLADVEIISPQPGDYIRYDATYLRFSNFKPSYNLYQLLDVDVPDPTIEGNSIGMDDMSLYYNHSAGKFETRLRRRFLDQLDDVSINEQENYQLLQLDTDGVWKNMDLVIARDNSPMLGGNLNANNFSINNSTYKVNTLLCNEPIKTLSYVNGDYWILQGVASTINEQCIVNIEFSTSETNAVAILMLEIQQSTGNILIGNLQNIKYEDGKPIRLSGANKTDLITITIQKIGNTYTTYITPVALNLASIGEGGVPSYRYDKNRYLDTQLFSNPSLYDSYFEYVELLLNFEEEVSTGKEWYEDKSDITKPVITTTTQYTLDTYTYGIQEQVSKHEELTDVITINPLIPIVLESDFTFECFIQHPIATEFMTIGMSHNIFSNSTDTLAIRYIGSINTTQDVVLEIQVHDNVYTYYNAYNYFKDKTNKFIHLAIVRTSIAPYIHLYIEGILQVGSVSTGITDVLDDITISSATIDNFKGYLNSVRLTKYARYSNNFTIPNMRYGLIGGAVDILDAQVFDTYMYMDKELEFDLFC